MKNEKRKNDCELSKYNEKNDCELSNVPEFNTLVFVCAASPRSFSGNVKTLHGI
ncbi:hypothetical protein KSX_04540 [Ktedonospora formicarum]|uniref:Uncharacterized protein n=1 Tax=Ktedonospora formicarum TaxID=2778364 RepID=A0A8J3HS65_9CHLR|nr:hypothetical protein KSX_04540 [Ktedonospora formicarum]